MSNGQTFMKALNGKISATPCLASGYASPVLAAALTAFFASSVSTAPRQARPAPGAIQASPHDRFPTPQSEPCSIA